MANVILVSGAPASGKTVLAEELAARLRLPLLSKDRIKETLFDALDVDDGVEWSRRLGYASFQMLMRWMGELVRGEAAFLVENAFHADDGPRLRGVLPQAVNVLCKSTALRRSAC